MNDVERFREQLRARGRYGLPGNVSTPFTPRTAHKAGGDSPLGESPTLPSTPALERKKGGCPAPGAGQDAPCAAGLR